MGKHYIGVLIVLLIDSSVVGNAEIYLIVTNIYHTA